MTGRVRPEHRLAADERGGNPRLVDLIRRPAERIAVKHHEVGEQAGATLRTPRPSSARRGL
jgi:hypothetical protein